MSTNVVRVNGDYKIQIGQGGTITLDTNSGTLNVLGNLTVTGTTTTLNTTNLAIEDNIIVLNRGETGNGVAAGTAGIQISRGTATRGDAQLFWDESLNWDDPVSDTQVSGLFVFKTADGTINGIRTVSINTNGEDLYLINSGYGVISVHGTHDYEQQVTDDDHIPNKKYVDDTIAYNMSGGGGGTTGPIFSAYLSSNQSVSNGAWAQLLFDTVVFDSDTAYDNTSLYAFTPQTAGYYLITARASLNTSGSNMTEGWLRISKNGVDQAIGSNNLPTGTNPWISSVATTIVYMNGTTDYIEAYVSISDGNSGNRYAMSGIANTAIEGTFLRN